MRVNIKFWARCLLKCTKINQACPSLTFRWWFGWTPAQPGPVVGGRSQESLQREMLPGRLADLVEGSLGPWRLLSPNSPLGFAGLLGFGCNPSAALTCTPKCLAQSFLAYQHTSLVNFIPWACILAPPSTICKEVDNLMRYWALKRFLHCNQVLTFMKTHL